MKSGGTIQSVARALAIVDFVSEQPIPSKATVIADGVGLNLPTAHHILATLVESGYLLRQGRAYCVSSDKVHSLQARLLRTVRPSAEALAALYRLAGESEETAYIASWTGTDVVSAAVAEGSRAVRVASLRIGLEGDAHARASGKALLAFGPPERLESYLRKGPLRALTPNTIVDPDQLREDLIGCERRGYALDQEEFIPGVLCLAAPFREGTPWPATALSIAMPPHRFFDNRAFYVETLLTCSDSTGAAAEEIA